MQKYQIFLRNRRQISLLIFIEFERMNHFLPPPWNYQKTYDFLMTLEGIKVNQYASIRLILETKFFDDLWKC